MLSYEKINQLNFIKLSRFSTLKWFYPNQLDKLSTTSNITNFVSKLTFSFDPEKARLFQPLRICVSFEKPLAGGRLILQNCIIYNVIIDGLLGWRKPLINLLLCRNDVNYTFEIRTCNNTQLFVPNCLKCDLNIWVHTNYP